jgi:hypothetical protein
VHAVAEIELREHAARLRHERMIRPTTQAVNVHTTVGSCAEPSAETADAPPPRPTTGPAGAASLSLVTFSNPKEQP